MPLVLGPGAPILLLVEVSHGAISVLEAAQELTRVEAAVLPHLFSVALHVRILELTNICFILICEVVRPLALKYTIEEVTLEVAAVGPRVLTMAILLAVLELSSVARLVLLPRLFSVAVLTVLMPVSLVAIAVRICENAEAIRLVKLPFTFIGVSRRVDQATVPLAHTVDPLALIDGSISVLDCAETMPTDLASAQPRHVNESSLVLISCAINIAKPVQLMLSMFFLLRICY